MKITIVEASVEDLKASRNIADALSCLLQSFIYDKEIITNDSDCKRFRPHPIRRV